MDQHAKTRGVEEKAAPPPKKVRKGARSRVFAGICLLSFITCIAATGLLVGTYHRAAGIWFDDYPAGTTTANAPPPVFGGLSSWRGCLFFAVNGLTYARDPQLPPIRWKWYRLSGGTLPGTMMHIWEPEPFDFVFSSEPPSPTSPLQLTLVIFPHWAVIAATAILPTLWLILRLRRRSARRRGLCEQCGYDLRASHERCPECGAPLPVT